MFKRVGRRGDTLVEVALAVGVFSMVAIAVAAVLSGSTSGAQTALETTVTREEIDTQAEALRFIQAGYAVDKNDTTDNKFYKLWHAIIDNPVEITRNGEDINQADFLNYAPTSCQEVYNSTEAFPGGTRSKAFIINPRALGAYTAGTDSTINDVNQVVLRNNSGASLSLLGTDPTPLQLASIYPRLIYQGSTSAGNNDAQDALISTDSNALFRAEGIYVVAVKDQKTTDIVDVIDGTTSDEAAFYDFYIRSCWYGTDSDQPSTISTVIRLYDPDVLRNAGQVEVHFNTQYGDGHTDRFGNSFPDPNKTTRKYILKDVGHRPGWTFQYSILSQNERVYDANHIFTPPSSVTNDGSIIPKLVITLKPEWVHTKYYINYDLNPPYTDLDTSSMVPYAGQNGGKGQLCYLDGLDDRDNRVGCILPSKDSPTAITASGYVLKGWCSVRVSVNGNCPSSAKSYSLGEDISGESKFPQSIFRASGSDFQTTLYAVWGERNEIITITAEWTSSSDYDSFMQLSKPGSSEYTSANYATNDINVTYNGDTYSLIKGDGDGQGNGWSGANSRHNEKFVINTLGGKNYYYSITKYASGGGWPHGVGNDITVKVTGNQGTNAEFKSSSASCSNGYWNVFAYKDGKIEERNTCSEAMEYKY